MVLINKLKSDAFVATGTTISNLETTPPDFPFARGGVWQRYIYKDEVIIYNLSI
jgi:hypothetical protein